MIRTYTITAPLGQQHPEQVEATLQAAGDKLCRLYTGFGGCQVLADQGVLTLILKVSGRDQWACSRAARQIGTSMLLRVKIQSETASIQLTRTAPAATTLTKEQGRGHRKPKGHLNNTSQTS